MEHRQMDRTAVSKVAVIGCGAIGSRMDEGRDGPVRTHARAYLAHEDASLVAVCDVERGRAEEAGRAWRVSGVFDSVEAMLRTGPFDVVSLATSTASREEPIRAIVAAGVASLLCEKPLAETWAEGVRVRAILSHGDTRAIVNFWRRFDPGLGPLLKELRGGALGALVRGAVTYGKGLNNNGSHAIDLLRAVGEEVTFVTSRGLVEDGRSDDPTLDVELSLGGATVNMIGTNHHRYSVFEIDLFFERGRLRIAEGRARISELRSDPIFPGYVSLTVTRDFALDPGGAFVAATREAIDRSKDPALVPTASVDDALRVLSIVEAARASHRSSTPVEPKPLP